MMLSQRQCGSKEQLEMDSRAIQGRDCGCRSAWRACWELLFHQQAVRISLMSFRECWVSTHCGSWVRDLTLCTIIGTPATDGFNYYAVLNCFCSYLLFNFYPWWLSLVKDRKLKNTNVEIQIHMEHKKDNSIHFREISFTTYTSCIWLTKIFIQYIKMSLVLPKPVLKGKHFTNNVDFVYFFV